MLLRHCDRREASRAACTAGSSSAARMAMMAITTSNSMSVKPEGFWREFGRQPTARLRRVNMRIAPGPDCSKRRKCISNRLETQLPRGPQHDFPKNPQKFGKSRHKSKIVTDPFAVVSRRQRIEDQYVDRFADRPG